MNSVFVLIVFLPLLGSLVAGLFCTAAFRRISIDGTPDDHAASAGHQPAASDGSSHDADDHDHPDSSTFPQYLTSGLLVVSALLSWYVFFDVAYGEHTYKVELMRWVHSGGLAADWTLRVDTLTAVMLVVVTTVSSLVHVYSIGYMSHDRHQARFFSYLSLFTFAMLMLVSADNLLQLFFGWEGVGLASYLLIGFWYDRPSANAAAIKAFIVNRVGDFGFALGIFAVFSLFGTLHFDEVFREAPNQAAGTMNFLGWQVPALTVTCILLFVG